MVYKHLCASDVRCCCQDCCIHQEIPKAQSDDCIRQLSGSEDHWIAVAAAVTAVVAADVVEEVPAVAEGIETQEADYHCMDGAGYPERTRTAAE